MEQLYKKEGKRRKKSRKAEKKTQKQEKKEGKKKKKKGLSLKTTNPMIHVAVVHLFSLLLPLR